MVGGSTTGEIHFGRHTDVPPPLRCASACAAAFQHAAPGCQPASWRPRITAALANLYTQRRFEAGTPAIAEAIGLGAAVNYLSSLGMDAVAEYEERLSTQLYEGLTSVPGVRVLGPPPHVLQARAGAARGRAGACLAAAAGVACMGLACRLRDHQRPKGLPMFSCRAAPRSRPSWLTAAMSRSWKRT